MKPVISVVGKSDVGKTTLLERLIPELKRRGYRVGTIKHDTHGFDMDKPGKDSWRHAQAGSDMIAVSSPSKVAMIRKVEQELSLDEVAQLLSPYVDLILTEGYKRGDKPKIEVFRPDLHKDLLCQEEELLAIVENHINDEDDHQEILLKSNIPIFKMDEISSLVDLIERKILVGK